jgi:hypothetical protein
VLAGYFTLRFLMHRATAQEIRDAEAQRKAAQELEMSRPKTEKDVFQEYYQQLPQSLKHAIWSAGVADINWSIGQKWNLGVEGIGIMAGEVGRLIVGISVPSEFSSNVARLLNVTPEQARGITADLHRRLFSRYENDLHETHGYFYAREAFLD